VPPFAGWYLVGLDPRNATLGTYSASEGAGGPGKLTRLRCVTSDVHGRPTWSMGEIMATEGLG